MTQLNDYKHVFPGSNTPSGFHSYYSNIISQENANKIFIIKGGPGTGKSSFMKKIAHYFVEKKVAVEYHHCSADPNSLDAIVIVPAKVAIIDGTFPHTLDPQTPGAVDEIINFSPFWDEAPIRANKSLIIETNQQRKHLFSKAYLYLGAAKQVYDAYGSTQKSSLDQEAFYKMEQTIMETIFKNSTPTTSQGKPRHLFGSAITPNGFADYLDTIIGHTGKTYLIKDAPGASAQHLMDLIMNRCLSLGLSPQCYHSPIIFEKIEDIVIPELDITITVSNEYHHARVEVTEAFDLTSCLLPDQLALLESDLKTDHRLISQLLQRGIETLSLAKAQHDILESYYIPHVRFNEISPVLQSVITQIESLILH